MRSLSSKCLLLCAALIPAAILASGSRATQPDAASPEFIILPGARNVEHNEQAGVKGIAYMISANYPADEPLRRIKTTLASLGWAPLEMEWMNPTTPSSIEKGWRSRIDARTPQRKAIHEWEAEWQNKAGDILSYSLKFVSDTTSEAGPVPDPSNSDLHVQAMLVPASQAAQLHDWAVKHAPAASPK